MISIKENGLSMREFLSRYTAAPLRFIDEFCYFIDKTDRDPHGIELDEVIDFLKICNIDRFYERFRKRYVEGYEYVIKIVKAKKTLGVRTKIYCISFDTFADICQLSNTKKGDECRRYFRKLHTFVKYYKDHIAEAINKNIIKGYQTVYIAGVPEDSELLKIGRTKDPRKRFKSYMTGRKNHPDIKFIMAVKDPKNVENCVKGILKDQIFSGRSELYKTDLQTMRTALEECGFATDHLSRFAENMVSLILFDEEKVEY